MNDTFENFNPVNKFEGIVMNPPFGRSAKTALEHVKKAFDSHLTEGGRLIAIVPDNAKMSVIQDAPLMATIHLPVVTFERAGTKIATKIIVLDKYGKKALRQAGLEVDLSRCKDINELFDKLENLSLPERIKSENPFAELEETFEKITYKKTKNGNTFYYIDGKRVSEVKAFNLSSEQAQQKADIIFDSFSEKSGIPRTGTRIINKLVVRVKKAKI